MSEKLMETVQQIFSQEREEDLKRMNEITEELVCAQLAEKYGETFAVNALGNRLNMQSTTILAAPEKEPELVFTVMMDMQGKTRDDYVSSRLLFQLERQIQEALAQAGLRGTANCVLPMWITDENDLSINLAELIHRHDVKRILCRIAMKEEIGEAVGVMEKISRNIPCGLAVHIYVLKETAFDQCAKDFVFYPSVSDAMIQAYQPVSTLFTLVENGKSEIDSSATLEGKEG